MPGLALRDAEAFVAPVDVVQGQGRDFAGAEAMGHQQEHDAVVPSANGRPAVDRLQQAADFLPGDRARDLVQTVGLRRLDGPTKVLRQDALAVEIAEEDVQDRTRVADARPAHVPVQLNDEATEDRRREVAEVVQVDLVEIGGELPQVKALDRVYHVEIIKLSHNETNLLITGFPGKG